jgi:hypothetical protein
MPAFTELVIHKNLQPIEYDQLVTKGYLKLRIELTLEHLRTFQNQYKVGDEFTFHSPASTNITTRITSIDTGEPHGSVYRVFIGFTFLA